MKPYFTIKIPSKSTPGDFHNVSFYKNGRVSCDCIRNGYYLMECSHKKKAILELSKILQNILIYEKEDTNTES